MWQKKYTYPFDFCGLTFDQDYYLANSDSKGFPSCLSGKNYLFSCCDEMGLDAHYLA